MSTRAEKVRYAELTPEQLAQWESWRYAMPAQASPYFSHHWVKEVDLVRKDVWVGLLRDDAGEVCAYLPFQQGRGGGAIPVGGALSDYHGVIARPGVQLNLRRAMRQMHVGCFDFTHVPVSQSTFAPLVRVQYPSRVIDLRTGLQAYLDERKLRGSSESKRARNRRNRLKKELGEIRFTGWSHDEDAFAQMLQWKSEQYVRTGQPDVFARDWTKELVTNLMRRGERGGFGGAMFLLHAGDRLAAVNYCLAEGPVVHAWFIAHDPELNKLSPGQALFEEMIHQLADTEIDEIDLGAGDYRFKLTLSNRERGLGAGYVNGSMMAGMMRGAEYGVRNLMEDLPLGKLSELPGKAMRRLTAMRGLA